MTATTKLALELLANSASNQVLANTTFAQLNQLVQAGAVDRLTTPPGSPANEALYIITATATGAWAGKENQLAYWLTSTSAWQYITPREGMLIHVNDEDLYYKYTGSIWEAHATLTAVQTFTGNKTLALTDINTYNVSQDGTAQEVTVPSQSTVTWTDDAEIHIEMGGAGLVTITGATGVTINGVSAGSFDLAGQFSVVTLKRTASNSWTLIGGLASDVVTGPASSVDGNIVLFNGVTGKIVKDGGVAYASGTWTPVLTFATPGDLSVAYSSQSGTWTRVGNRILLDFNIVTSTFTHTTASGALRISGLPFTVGTGSIGSLHWSGITKAGYTDLSSLGAAGFTLIVVQASGSGQPAVAIASGDMPSGGTVTLRGGLMYSV